MSQSTDSTKPGSPASAGTKAVVLDSGSHSVRIRHEPSNGRLEWRLIWYENGLRKSEMFGSRDEAIAAGEVKLSELTSGERVLTREEVDELFDFKLQIRDLERRVASVGFSLEEAVTEILAAEDILSGWKLSGMAQTILQNYAVENPLTVDEVKRLYLRHLGSGYKRNYDDKYLENAERFLSAFSKRFSGRRVDTITEREVDHFIKTYKVRGGGKGKRGLVRGSSRTRSHIKNYLQCMFDYAKNVLRALPEDLATVVERIPPYRFVTTKPPLYTAEQTNSGFKNLPDVETLLYAGLRAFAGLRGCEARRIEGKDIKKTYILVRPEVGKKRPDSNVLPKPRKAPITAPLGSILHGIKLPKGRLFFTVDLEGKILKAFRKAGLPARRNVLRSLFVSLRLPVIKSRRQVADEAGHDVFHQKRDYEGRVSAAEVPKHWALRFSCKGLPYTISQYAPPELRQPVDKDCYAEGQLQVPWTPKRIVRRQPKAPSNESQPTTDFEPNN
jgi:integrase